MEPQACTPKCLPVRRQDYGTQAWSSAWADKMYPRVDYEKCSGCKNCVEVCPGEVYRIEGDRCYPSHAEDCIECWACVEQCPTQSIQLIDD